MKKQNKLYFSLMIVAIILLISVCFAETKVISKADFTVANLIAEKVKIDERGIQKNTGIKIVGFSWINTAEHRFMTTTDKYENGKEYTLRMFFEPEVGYKFENLKVFVNGEQVEIQLIKEPGQYKFEKTFNAKKEDGSQIEINPITKKIEWSNASKWAKEELNKANEIDLIPNIFEKNDLTTNITRREFAHIAVRLWEKVSGKTVAAGPKAPFTDTSDPEVLKAYNLEITKGTTANTFSPDDLITREQMATMMVRALQKAGINIAVDVNNAEKFADDNELHSWGKEAVYYMSNIGLIKGVGNNKFGVVGNATKEQALLISVRSAEMFLK